MTDEAILIAAHTSLSIQWGTTSPYRIEGASRATKVGYAQIPCVTVTAWCSHDVSAIIPIIRQHVYRELAERGWQPDTIAFQPSVMRERDRCLFLDTNRSSGSEGRRKYGSKWEVRFEITDRELKTATFPLWKGSFSRIPDRTDV